MDGKEKKSSRAISANELVRALVNELRTSMREASPTKARAQMGVVRKVLNTGTFEGYSDFLEAGEVTSVLCI